MSCPICRRAPARSAPRANLRIAQQARPEDHDRVTEAYQRVGVRAEVEPFFRDMPRRAERGATGHQPGGRLFGWPISRWWVGPES